MTTIQNTDDTEHKQPGFPKGRSGNPGGRPKVAKDFREKCRSFMSRRGWKKLEAMAEDLEHGDCFQANKLIAAYAYGAPPNKLEIGGLDGASLHVNLVWSVGPENGDGTPTDAS